MTQDTPIDQVAQQPPEWVREVLRCPVGRHPLLDVHDDEGRPALVCAQDCGEPGVRRQYRIEDGIPVLLADEATIRRQ